MGMNNAENAAEQIRRAYGSRALAGAYIAIADVRDSLDLTDEQAAAGFTHLYRTDAADLIPNSQQGDITDRDRAAAVLIGGQPRHLIAIR